MLRELAAALEACTAAHALILVLEDLHWSDASTVEALALLARRQEAARFLVLGTYRPVELILRQHPLKAVKQELQLHGYGADAGTSLRPRPTPSWPWRPRRAFWPMRAGGYTGAAGRWPCRTRARPA